MLISSSIQLTNWINIPKAILGLLFKLIIIAFCLAFHKGFPKNANFTAFAFYFCEKVPILVTNSF